MTNRDSLSAHQAEHGFAFTSRLEHPADRPQQEQLHHLAGIVADLRAEKMMQHIGNALGAVPLKGVQVVTDRVVLVLVRHHGQRLTDAVFMIQPIPIFQI